MFFYHTAFLESCYVYNIVPHGVHIKKQIKISSTGFTGPRENILCKSELELLNELVEENAFNFFKYCHEFNFKFDEFECHISEIRFIEWFSKLVSILENFELKN